MLLGSQNGFIPFRLFRGETMGIKIRHEYFSGTVMVVVALAIGLGAVGSRDWSDGQAILGTADTSTKVYLGLWNGVQQTSGPSVNVIFYEWCFKGGESTDAELCSMLEGSQTSVCIGLALSFLALILGTLLVVDLLKEETQTRMAKLASATSVVAALCYGVGLGLWAQLVTELTNNPKSTRPMQLSLGISWLAGAACFVLSVLGSMSYYFSARRVEILWEQLQEQAHQPASKKPHKGGSYRGKVEEAELGAVSY